LPRTEQYRTSLIHGRFVGCDFLEIVFAAVVGEMVPRLGKARNRQARANYCLAFLDSGVIASTTAPAALTVVLTTVAPTVTAMSATATTAQALQAAAAQTKKIRTSAQLSWFMDFPG